ncbi:MAG TPA: 50S ribosomal protein L15 [Atribacteraceae bacterium]|nr:50S ribosomal protein L15 [Atribacteraceae bacterium]
MKINDLKPKAGSFHRKKRVGRGIGSGHGKTSCRGHKGQKSRSGGSIHPHFEGGQMPLVRRVPKRGFHNIYADRWQTVNLRDLNRFEDGSEVDRAVLIKAGIVRKTPGKRKKIKVLANGDINRKLTVKAEGFSSKARALIEEKGGSAEVV